MAGDLDTLFNWIEAKQMRGHCVALATVVRTWSSAPRAVGSQLAVADDGAFEGSVSGGCVEAAVIEAALSVIAGQPAQILEFDVANSQAFDIGLTCGGHIRILVQRIDENCRTAFAATMSNHRVQKPCALAIRCNDGAMASIAEHEYIDDAALLADASIDAAALAAVRSGRSRFADESENLFIRAYPAPAHLYLIGAVHIAQLLAPMAQQAGFQVCVIDPRRAFATPARFAGIALDTDWPDEALRKVVITAADAVVTLTHDTKLDDPALIAALDSPAFYIGALGSRRTHALRIERLTALGLVDAGRRIHGPVGLPLGGRAPAEIAVSILAQIIAEKYAP